MTVWNESQPSLQRALPSVTAILNTAVAAELVQRFGHMASTEAIRATVAEAREAMKAGAAAPGAQDIAQQALARLDARGRSNLRPLFNLTGTVLHTNLGRAVLAESAMEAAVAGMRHPVALESALEPGSRRARAG